MQTGVGLTVTLRVRLCQADVRAAGDLVDDARLLALLGDVASELLIRLDGDQGSLRAYDAIEFVAPVRAGDYLEITGVITKVGQTSRVIAFEARKVVEALRLPELAPTAADALADPRAVCRAIATCVVPLERQRRPRIVLPALSAPPPDVAELPEPRPVITPAPRVIVTPTDTELVVIAALGSGDGALDVAGLCDEAARCRDAGAAVVQLPNVRGVVEAAAAVRKRAEVIVQLASDAARTGERQAEERAAGLSSRPELAAVVCGSVNRDSGVYQNPRPAMRELCSRIRAAGALPALECWDLGHLDEALAMAAEGVIARPLHFQLVVGWAGGVGAREEVVRFMASQLPVGATWALAAAPAHQAAMMEVGVRLGGHVRVAAPEGGSGLAVHAVVTRARELARALGRVVVDAERARQLLGLAAL